MGGFLRLGLFSVAVCSLLIASAPTTIHLARSEETGPDCTLAQVCAQAIIGYSGTGYAAVGFHSAPVPYLGLLDDSLAEHSECTGHIVTCQTGTSGPLAVGECVSATAATFPNGSQTGAAGQSTPLLCKDPQAN